MTAQLSPLARWIAQSAGTTISVGLLLTIGVGVPVLLPVSLAGASAIAVRVARGLPTDPIGDATAGIRSDTVRFAMLTLVISAAVAGPLWLAGVVLADADGIGAGIRVGLLAAGLAALPVVVVGCVLASATTTPTPRLPLVATAVVLGNARISALIALGLLAAILPIGSPVAPALLPLSLGIAYPVAVRLAWRSVDHWS